MEIRIKTGEDLKCSYTGEIASALVNLCYEYPAHDDHANCPTTHRAETGWMGRRALEQALSILNSVEGRTPQPVMVARGFVAEAGEPIAAGMPVVMAARPASVNPKAMVDAFGREMAALVENPPKTRENEKDGLSEHHIREVMRKYVTSFPDPVGAMAPILNGMIGMPKERVETLVGMLKHG